jgi:hypothetical protein
VRLLIDECIIDERLRHLFPGHDCQTAEAVGFNVIVSERNAALNALSIIQPGEAVRVS